MITLPGLHDRPLHPGAWWLWAGLGSLAAAQVTNMAVLLLLGLAMGWVVVVRRPRIYAIDSLTIFLRLAVLIVAIRVLVQCLVVGGNGSSELFRLPQVPLPQWLAGVSLGGPVTLEAALAAAAEGMRLAVMLLTFGAANALAPPARLLRYLPRGFQAAGVAVTVALGAFAELTVAFRRVYRARQLRAVRVRGVRGALSIAAPVMEEALDRALITAGALDARGFGRGADRAPGVTWALLLGPGLSIAGSYLVLTQTTILGGVTLGGGLALGLWGIRQAGRGVITTKYQPDPWRWPENFVVLSALATVALLWILPTAVAHPDPWSLALPQLTPPALLAVALFAAPGVGQ